MAGQGLMRWTAAAMCTLTLQWASPLAAREPPGPGCIDLRDLAGGWRSGERELLIRSPDGFGARLELDTACPPFAEGLDLETFAPGAWACPDVGIFVRGDGTSCPVVRMSVLSRSELAAALSMREMRMKAAVTLDRVLARGQHWRDIRGTTDRCVDARFLRGWSNDSKGLVVEVLPGRHSGNRYYRIETTERCSFGSAHSIRVESRSGGAAVCGRPGDKVVLMSHASSGLTTMGGVPSGAFDRGCEISGVTPLPRE